MLSDFTQHITKLRPEASAAVILDDADRDVNKEDAIDAMIDAFRTLNEFRSQTSFEVYHAVKMVYHTMCRPLLDGLIANNTIFGTEVIIRSEQGYEVCSTDLFLKCSELEDRSAYLEECRQALDECNEKIDELLQNLEEGAREETEEKVLSMTDDLETFLDGFEASVMSHIDGPER